MAEWTVVVESDDRMAELTVVVESDEESAEWQVKDSWNRPYACAAITT